MSKLVMDELMDGWLAVRVGDVFSLWRGLNSRKLVLSVVCVVVVDGLVGG